MYLFHQGRAAENAFFSILSRDLREESPRQLSPQLDTELKERLLHKFQELENAFYIIPNNSHFDTTEANVQNNNIVPLNLPCKEHLEAKEDFPFRGNIDLDELESLLEHESERVPIVYLTITNNTGGGQPVSMDNIRKVRKLTQKYKKPFFFDCCRFAENAWYIKNKEAGYEDKSITDIVHEMFTYVDGFQLSLKKDGLVNIGGALLIKESGIFNGMHPDVRLKLTDHQILTEGHPTYGGMAGRDLKGLIEGLKTIVSEEYLDYRIGQTQRFGDKLVEMGIPVIRPFGGHAVYIDMDKFFEGTPYKDDDFKGIAFTALLLLAGHRLCELGVYAFGMYKDGKELPPDPRMNYVRAAIPRLAYEDQDLYSLAEAIKVLHEHKDKIPAIDVEFGRNLPLRHFKSHFAFRE